MYPDGGEEYETTTLAVGPGWKRTHKLGGWVTGPSRANTVVPKQIDAYENFLLYPSVTQSLSNSTYHYFIVEKSHQTKHGAALSHLPHHPQRPFAR
jgi:hypothetical protein